MNCSTEIRIISDKTVINSELKVDPTQKKFINTIRKSFEFDMQLRCACTIKQNINDNLLYLVNVFEMLIHFNSLIIFIVLEDRP